MKRFTAVWCFALVLISLSVGNSSTGNEGVIKSIIEARTQGKTLPLPSSRIPDLDTKRAYILQKGVVESMSAIGDSIRGFKAGLTSTAAQERFGVREPVLGPLFGSGELHPGASINVKDFVKLFIEAEIGYVARKRIRKPVQDVAALKTMIAQVFPAIELPDLRFTDLKRLKAADIIVDAASSAAYIVGKQIPVSKADVTRVAVTLTRDGMPVNKGKAADAMGDQWKALLWLVNGATSNGYTIEPGRILITGSLGKMIPATPGKYRADFGALGKIVFVVR